MEKFTTDVVVVGAGLFGSMTAKFLKSKGIETIIIDRRDPMSASKCSSGIWRPGWAHKIQREVEESLPIIAQFTAIDTLPIFDVDKEIETTIDFIDCNNILNEDFLEGDVKGCTYTFNRFNAKIQSVIVDVDGIDIEIECNYVVVCAGAFTNQVLNRLKMPLHFGIDGLWGAVIHSSDKLKQNYIQNWAPYKQLYGLTLQRGGEEVSYFTMGSSAKNPPAGGDNRTLNIGEKLVQYAAATGKLRNIVEIPEGLRPFFVEKEMDFVNRHGVNVLSATGGAKNSTLLCGYAAQRIFQEISGKHN